MALYLTHYGESAKFPPDAGCVGVIVAKIQLLPACCDGIFILLLGLLDNGMLHESENTGINGHG